MQGAAQVAGRKVRRRSRGTGVRRSAVREGESIPRRICRPPGVSGGKRGRRGREGREEMPVHVAQTGTLTSQGGFERRGRSMLHRRAHSCHRGDSRGGVGPLAQTGPLSIGKWLPRWKVQEKRGLGVVSEDTLPRCTEGHRLLIRRADSHSVASFSGSENSPRKGARLLARGPRAEASPQSYLRELWPSGGARLRFGGALFWALVRERTLLKVG
jgi:hypothetical protein